ncbi:MAG: hypothetical protein R3C68_03315 [Myxococcota bacterium]
MNDDEFDYNDSGASPPRSGGKFPESIRKVLVSGLSAVFMTEEGIRQTLGDLRLPKEAMSFLMQQAERSRRELFRVVSDELKGFLKGVDLTGEVRRALTGLKIEINAEVRFKETGESEARVNADFKDAKEEDSADTDKPVRKPGGRLRRRRKVEK